MLLHKATRRNRLWSACLLVVSKQYGFKILITKIREAAGNDKKGTNPFGMIKAAEKLDFSANGVKGNKEEFLNN
ncbi:cysteine peptidase family C39 domain-containing protein [Helicovermis profundi]|uniref:cysteine peptidase family C39 domain-containing protein n=1 Tax=Helicovermis profundi TaxID=3065157 RepID=UPI003BAEC66C